MKNFPLQIFFFKCTSANIFFKQHLPANNFFPIFFNHVLTQKRGSFLLLSIITVNVFQTNLWYYIFGEFRANNKNLEENCSFERVKLQPLSD